MQWLAGSAGARKDMELVWVALRLRFLWDAGQRCLAGSWLYRVWRSGEVWMGSCQLMESEEWTRRLLGACVP